MGQQFYFWHLFKSKNVFSVQAATMELKSVNILKVSLDEATVLS